MMFLLDLLLIIIVVVTVARCTVRGFVKSVINLISLVVSFFVARYFT
ncbi:MAG: CvpA family protein, partial [Clostridia bacterium]|nr:CvpA family protein [Clostridia bacterium]